jgi:hypothetical protein
LTLLLRPRGRGAWALVTLTLTGRRADPLLVQRGALIPIGGITFRVVEVRP